MGPKLLEVKKPHADKRGLPETGFSYPRLFPIFRHSPNLVCEIFTRRLPISFRVSRKVPLTTLVFGASNRLRLPIRFSGLKRQGIAPLIRPSRFVGVL